MDGRIVHGWSRKLAGRLVRPAGFAIAFALSGLAMASPAMAEMPTIAASAAAAKFQAAARPVWTARASPRPVHTGRAAA